jgi:hypothetical protein
MIVFMNRLGFRCHWQQGYQLQVELPETMKAFYPPQARAFHFPVIGSDLDGLSHDKFYEELERNIGTIPTMYFRQLYRATVIEPDRLQPTFNVLVSYVYDLRLQTFVCRTCKCKFLLSEYSYCDTEHQCMNCANSCIPF